MKVEDEKDLGRKVKNGESTIEVEGDLAGKIIRIKVTGDVAWLVCVGAIGVALASTLMAPATAGVSEVASLVAGSVAATTLGVSTTVTAVLIAVGGGGVGVLNKLRDYKMEKLTDEHIILHRRK